MDKKNDTRSSDGVDAGFHQSRTTSLNGTEENIKVGPTEVNDKEKSVSDIETNNKSGGDHQISGSSDPTLDRKEKSSEGSSSLTGNAPPTKPLPSPPNERLPPQNVTSANGDKKDGESKGVDGSKKDKGKLRKGKWTVEEEEYTSRIIHHFSTGLLTLPDGSTLRSYLAEKLNCDPMRITKKFTGACCLGRRVYHLRDRPRASAAEVELAKVELNHLEQRFRMRIEQEQSGIPFTRGHETSLQNRVSSIFPIQSTVPGSMINPWTQNFSGVDLGTSNQLSLALAQGNRSLQSGISSQYPFGSIASSANPWLLPNNTESPLPAPSSSSSLLSQNDASLRLLNNLVNSWAWAQATALSPALTLLQQQNHSEEHQRQLRSAYEEKQQEEEQRRLKDEMPAVEQTSKHDASEVKSANGLAKQVGSDTDSESPSLSEITPAQQLQRSYEAHLEALRRSSIMNGHTGAATSMLAMGNARIDHGTRQSISNLNRTAAASKVVEGIDLEKDEKPSGTGMRSAREEENRKDSANEGQNAADEEAGTILLGFIKSLRQSYEDAIEEKANISTIPVVDGVTSKTKSKDIVGESVPVLPQRNRQSSQMPSNLQENEDISIDTTKSETKKKKRSREIVPSSKIPGLGSIPLSTASCFPPGRHGRPASVTDTSALSRSETSSGTSSQPTESSSSIEDSDSKSDKTEPSSSEESEKECTSNKTDKGPPRKRLKASKKVKQFTAQNLLEHSKRMSKKFDNNEDF